VPRIPPVRLLRAGGTRSYNLQSPAYNRSALDELHGLAAGHIDGRQQHETIRGRGQHVDDPTVAVLLPAFSGVQGGRPPCYAQGLSFFGSLASTSAYEVSTSSATSSSGIVPSRVMMFQPCFPT
jgi:hypothetical protein